MRRLSRRRHRILIAEAVSRLNRFAYAKRKSLVLIPHRCSRFFRNAIDELDGKLRIKMLIVAVLSVVIYVSALRRIKYRSVCRESEYTEHSDVAEEKKNPRETTDAR